MLALLEDLHQPLDLGRRLTGRGGPRSDSPRGLRVLTRTPGRGTTRRRKRTRQATSPILLQTVDLAGQGSKRQRLERLPR